MPLVPFNDLMAEAGRGGYAVGYFEGWDLHSLLAVADAAEAMHSPVLLGFSGLYLPDPDRVVKERLSVYAALGLEVCRSLSVPANLIFNESPYMDWVLEAARLGFGMVMFSDGRLGFDEQLEQVSRVVRIAHRLGAAVEAEAAALPGVGGELTSEPGDRCLTDPEQARWFVERTGVDAFAVNVGQAHLHGRQEVRLNLERLAELHRVIPAPLVLHGASSVHEADLAEAIRQGVRKINVGSRLKQVYFEAIRRAVRSVGEHYNPYEVVGSGLPGDVLTVGRLALQEAVGGLMRLFGSVGRA